MALRFWLAAFCALLAEVRASGPAQIPACAIKEGAGCGRPASGDERCFGPAGGAPDGWTQLAPAGISPGSVSSAEYPMRPIACGAPNDC